jgi:hypothetical protein
MTSQCSTKTPFLHDEDVGRYPTGWSAETGKASVNDHEIAFGHDHVVLVFQRVRQTLNESEKPSRPGAMWALC